jgi:hypothetical protein
MANSYIFPVILLRPEGPFQCGKMKRDKTPRKARQERPASEDDVCMAVAENLRVFIKKDVTLEGAVSIT